MVCMNNDNSLDDDLLSDLNIFSFLSDSYTRDAHTVISPTNPILSFPNSFQPSEQSETMEPETVFLSYDGCVIPKADFGEDTLNEEPMSETIDLNFEEEDLFCGPEPELDRSSPDYVQESVQSPPNKKARLHSEMDVCIKSESESPAPAGTIISLPKSVADPAARRAYQNSILYMIEGIDVDDKHTYLGGKGNSIHYLPLQVVEMNHEALAQDTQRFGMQYLTCRAMVLGFDKKSREMKSLGSLSCDKPFLFDRKRGRWAVRFEDILIQYASHHYGQRLALKFQLIEKGTKVLFEFETKVFQTITKRGKEKEQVREKTKEAARTPISVLCLESVDPPVGATSGGQLVKLIFSGNLSAIAVDTVCVKFGGREASMVHCSKNNELICETPALVHPGLVHVTVEVVKKGLRTPVSSVACFNYLDPKHPETPQLVLNHFFSKLSL